MRKARSASLVARLVLLYVVGSAVIDEAKILFDLDVAEVVPVTDLRRIQFIEQGRQFAFARDFFVTAPAFDSEADLLDSGVCNDAAQTIFDPLQVSRCDGFPLFHGLEFFANVFAREKRTFFGEFDQDISDRLHGDCAKVHDDKGRT